MRIGWLDLRLWRIAFSGCLVSVVTLSLLPNPASILLDTGWDKANHTLAFFVLGLLGLRAFPETAWRVTVGLLGYGALIEALQGMTSYRAAEWYDLLADSIGITTAMGVLAVLRHWRFRAV